MLVEKGSTEKAYRLLLSRGIMSVKAAKAS